ncbi:unnamed protein product [Staurois parvus]|uniref:Uncharacterized protein n=1 Tax=Staurois parvus TaxID=386267 RepID=A0ABN9GAE2_9NEOB|nr:unnamed protein product [Staurois parvus]
MFRCSMLSPYSFTPGSHIFDRAGPRFVWARERIHLNVLLCPVTRRKEVPALLLNMQPTLEPRFPVQLRFPVWAACH